MPLQIPTPPTTVDSTVRSNLQNVAEGNLSSIEALHQLPADQLTLTLPHQIFTIGRDQLAEAATLNTATAVGWRYLVSARGQIIASAETVTSPDDGQEVFSQLTEGPFVEATAAAITAVRALPQLGVGTFELRLLRIPALYLMALWLHPSLGVGDLLVPLAPTPVGTAGVPSPAGDLLQQLNQRARDMIAHSLSDDGLIAP